MGGMLGRYVNDGIVSLVWCGCYDVDMLRYGVDFTLWIVWCDWYGGWYCVDGMVRGIVC